MNKTEEKRELMVSLRDSLLLRSSDQGLTFRWYSSSCYAPSALFKAYVRRNKKMEAPLFVCKNHKPHKYMHYMGFNHGTYMVAQLDEDAYRYAEECVASKPKNVHLCPFCSKPMLGVLVTGNKEPKTLSWIERHVHSINKDKCVLGAV